MRRAAAAVLLLLLVVVMAVSLQKRHVEFHYKVLQ
jgi:hypothetical protein